MIRRYIISLLLVGLLFIILGCGGGGGSEDAPPEATITINPTEITVSDASVATTEHTEYYQIVVKDGNGIPLKNVELRITFVWAVPDVYGVVHFYDGGNPVDSPLDVETDEDGAYILTVKFQSGGGMTYNGTIQVTSGSLFASADFSVDTGDEEQPTP